MAYLYIIIAAIFSTFGNLLLKYSRKGLTEVSSFADQYFNPFFIAAVSFYIVNVFLFSKALDYIPVNIGYPMLAALGFSFLALSSWIFLGEKLLFIQIFGIFIIVFGIYLLSVGTNG
tara:strand:+ start:963 stop:1313 length:351 start_codon:yes stop_codon:yes gene_type:complete